MCPDLCWEQFDLIPCRRQDKVNPRDIDTKINISVQGETLEEKYLAIICLVLEGFPQFVLVGLTMVHWHSPFRCQALELFRF